MIHAILLYALLGYPNNDNYEQVISWNLPFQTYEQCSMFYLQNKQNLHDGVIPVSYTHLTLPTICSV